jgi:hypothetical protein
VTDGALSVAGSNGFVPTISKAAELGWGSPFTGGRHVAYDNLNPGMLICRCLDKDGLAPVEGASAILTWVEADASFGGRLPLYDQNGNKADSVLADTDEAGVAFVSFFWDPTHIGWLLSDSPAIRVSATGPAGKYSGIFTSKRVNKLYYTTRVGNERIYECINLGQIWSGGKGSFQFRSTENHAIDAISKLKQILEFRAKVAEQKLPKVPFLKIMRPSTEMVSLVGGFDILMDKQADPE